MTNKDINKRIKCLLSQNKYLRQKLKELEIKNKDLQEWIDIDNEIIGERNDFYFILCKKYNSLSIEYTYLKELLEKTRRQRNYYSRIVRELRLKLREKNNDNI